MADPMDDDDDYNWDLCIAEIDKVERAAVEWKTAQQQNGPQASAPRPSFQTNAGQLPQQGQTFTPQRGNFPQPQQAPSPHNSQAPSHQNPQAYSHQQRPMLIQPVAPPRPSVQQAPGARWQVPGTGVVQNAAPRQPLQPVPAQQNGPLPRAFVQAKPNAPAAVSTGQSSNSVPAAGTVQQDLWRLQEELRQNEQAIRDKDGCISLLRSRVQTAESETFELRKRAAGVSGSSQQTSSRQTTDMQREIERLQAQLLFKDQEVQEAKRAKAEKDAKMKEAQEAAQRLEAELRAAQSQQRASPGSAAKRRREVDTDSPTRPLALNQQLNRLTSEPGAPPGRSPRALFKSPAHGRGGERPQQNQSQESDRAARTPVAPSAAAAAAAGVTSSSTAAASPAASPAAAPTAPEAVVDRGAEARVRGDGGAAAAEGPVPKSKETEPKSLRSVERLETVGARLREAESGACFVQKLFAVAAGDVFGLVSGGDGAERNGVAADGRKAASSLMGVLAESSGEGQAMDVDVVSEREAFRDAFVKVMNGLKPVATLFSPLRAALDSKKPTSVYASLRVLRVLLRLDATTRFTVLGSAAATPLGANWVPIQPSTPTTQATAQIGSDSHVPLSSVNSQARLSSRVKIGPASKAHAAASSADVSGRQRNGKGKATVESDPGPSGVTELGTRVASRFAASGSGRDGAPIDCAFFDRLIELAVEAEDPRAQFEAASTLGLLVAHVPATQWTELAFLVTERKLEPLIGLESPPPVRGVALHVVHLLCESPPLVSFVFSDEGGKPSDGGGKVSDGPGKVSDGGGKVSDGTRASEATSKRPETDPSTSGPGDSPGGATSLFSAVAACLGPETKDPVLKHAAVQLLAFVHGLSDNCAGLLTSLGRNESDVREPTPQLGPGATDAGPDAEARHVSGDVDKAEPPIVARLLDVLDEELRGEAEGADCSGDERAALRGEACSLLASLVQRDEALCSIFVSSRRTRLAISVVTRMIKLAETATEKASRSIVEVAKSVQRRILDNMPPQTNDVVNV
ncbi:hypothetical protein KFL_000600100 [Klebsormidium nitens]|uniref:Uncharacterized protein n=1 Tax=Klebsormidium nitens TaxID=105231 RepID=A0A1Y1HRG5_KLENI|nr:hypothetical protein KFL_000600100 [Klebsormidium nitens]|eukprot:GAQ80693.1 hypothetical protein KFL_000600100 [Klebsormidium nitens]